MRKIFSENRLDLLTLYVTLRWLSNTSSWDHWPVKHDFEANLLLPGGGPDANQLVFLRKMHTLERLDFRKWNASAHTHLKASLGGFILNKTCDHERILCVFIVGGIHNGRELQLRGGTLDCSEVLMSYNYKCSLALVLSILDLINIFIIEFWKPCSQTYCLQAWFNKV